MQNGSINFSGRDTCPNKAVIVRYFPLYDSH
jgi:hypothetical protein